MREESSKITVYTHWDEKSLTPWKVGRFGFDSDVELLKLRWWYLQCGKNDVADIVTKNLLTVDSRQTSSLWFVDGVLDTLIGTNGDLNYCEAYDKKKPQ